MLFQDYKFSQKLFSNKKVLEVGCNQGITTLQISKFSKRVIAIDNNKNHLSIAKKKRKKKNIKYIKINFFDKKKMLRLGKFEVIYLREILEYIDFNPSDFDKLCDSFRSPHIWYKENDKWFLRKQIS